MKKIIKQYKLIRYITISSLLLVFALTIFSCEEYLDIPPEANITEEQIFGSYETFQGFQDQLMNNLVDYNRHGARVTHSIAGEALSPTSQTVYNGNIGNYRYIVDNRGIYPPAESSAFKAGLWSNFWENIRIANLCLEKLDSGILTEATNQQRDWLRGQALFFRAYYYYEIVRAFGSMPYLEEVTTAEDQDLKRFWSYEKGGMTYNNTQACFEKIAEDFQEASTLLPVDWPLPNVNYGRPSAVAALGFKAKALQFSASPLFNEEAGGGSTYNTELLNRAAAACVETINLAQSIRGIGVENPSSSQVMPPVNSYGLSNFEDLRQAFATNDGTQPYTREVLFHRPVDRYGDPIVRQSAARGYGIRQLTNQAAAQGSQNHLDKFEMSDGSRYNISYDNDPTKRWENRDKRFDFNFYVHNDQIGDIILNLSAAKLASDGALNSNAVRKFLPDGVNKDNTGNATYSTPLLRLADIYLTYAECVFESTGSYIASAAGSSLTAEEAVNIVRNRAGQPDVAATLPFYNANTIKPESEELESDPPFRLLYRNERAVELAYEGVYWFDLRRWKRAHLKDGSPIQALVFDVDNSNNIIESSVARINQQTFTFKDPHYWMIFYPDDITRFSPDFPQNPGW